MSECLRSQWLRRQGYRVVATSSGPWYEAEPGVFQPADLRQPIPPTAAEITHLQWRHGARAVRFSAPLAFPRGVVSCRMVLKSPPSLEPLEGVVHERVEAGLQACCIGPISFEQLAAQRENPDQGDLDLHGHPALDLAGWKRLCLSGQGLPGFEAWAATVEGVLAAAIIVLRQGATGSILFSCSLRRFQARHVFPALLHRVSQELLRREGMECLVFDAPFPTSEALDFGLALGFQPELMRDCVEVHPLYRTFVVPFLSAKPGAASPDRTQSGRLSTVWGIHQKGLEPLEEQVWPPLLRTERARLVPPPRVLAEARGIQVTSATPFDVRALVDLHEACFSKEAHILVRLGRPFLQAVYRWFVSSPITVVLVARRGDEILGLTTLADKPYNLPMMRACKHAFVKGCLRHPLAIFNLELMQRLLRMFLPKRKRAQVDPTERVGQIAFTGVDPGHQGLGIGKILKEASIKVCKERGLTAVSTGVRRQNHRARQLNEQAGFVEVPSRNSRQLIYLRLDLRDPSREGNPRPLPSPHPPSHIVIVTAYYWPVLAATTHLMKDLGEGLAEAGHQVSILSNGPNHAHDPADDHPLLKGRIHRAWNPFLRELGVVAKLSEYLWFLAYFFFRGLFVRNIDLIFVVSTPPLAGLPAALLARLKGAKLVYNLQDIFPDSAVVAGILPSGGLLYRWFRKAEEATYRVSDLVLSISPSFSTYVQKVAPGTSVETVPNWVDTDHIRPRLASEDPAITRFRGGGRFVVQYAGNIGFVQNLETLLLAAECLKDVPEIRFVFIGDGNAKQSLKALAEQLQLANCDFLPMQPLDLVPSVYNACDLGVIPLKPGAAQIAVPSKTWNYLAAGRPVIGCVEEDSTLAKVIHEGGAGAVVPPNSPGDLAKAILDYWQSPNRVQEDGVRGRAYVEQNLSRRVAIAKFIRTFEALLGRLPKAIASTPSASPP